MQENVLKLNGLKISILDLAVGSPNAEMVYVFRTYPVVKIVANVIPLTKELQVTDTSFKFKVCWSLESKFELQNDTGRSGTLLVALDHKTTE